MVNECRLQHPSTDLRYLLVTVAVIPPIAPKWSGMKYPANYSVGCYVKFGRIAGV